MVKPKYSVGQRVVDLKKHRGVGTIIRVNTEHSEDVDGLVAGEKTFIYYVLTDQMKNFNLYSERYEHEITLAVDPMKLWMQINDL